MGLIIPSLELSNGLSAPNAYARIAANHGDQDNQSYMVRYFISKEAHASGVSEIYAEEFSFSHSAADDAPNTIKQGYLNLKQLPQFATAIDDLN
jgi:hypothetical protein